MHKSTRTLLEAWKKLNTEKSPYILEGDKEINDHQQYYKDYETFIKNLDSGFSNPIKFHTGLLPVPFSGNILKAKIFILALNPGFSIRDYYEESYDKKIIKRRRQRLHNINSEKEFPWLSLNPQFAWTGGFDYWTKKFAPILKELMAIRSINYIDCLKLLSKNIAVIELVPYHSKSFGLSKTKMNKLRSVELMKAFVIEDLVERAKRNKAIIIVTRKANYWKLKSSENIIIYDKNEARSASFGLNSKGGKAILNLLRKE